MENKRGISGSTIKIIAVVTMFIDHFAACLIESYLMSIGGEILSSDITIEANKVAYEAFRAQNQTLLLTDEIMRYIGRIAFPLFCFLLVEGFLHTHSKLKYARNLAIFAIISELPFDLAFWNKPIELNYQNVFFTLLIAFLAMWAIDTVGQCEYSGRFLSIYKYFGAFFAGLCTAELWSTSFFGSIAAAISPEFLLYTSIFFGIMIACFYIFRSPNWDEHKKIYLSIAFTITFVAILLGNVLKTDYSGWGVFAVLVFYHYRNDRKKAMLNGVLSLVILQPNEVFGFLALLPVKFYNGERGLKLKYFFYAFYPVHLAVFAAILHFVFHII